MGNLLHKRASKNMSKDITTQDIQKTYAFKKPMTIPDIDQPFYYEKITVLSDHLDEIQDTIDVPPLQEFPMMITVES